ncbi:MAG: sigma-54-dependent transcriptional regulator [Bacteroidales bacterium]
MPHERAFLSGPTLAHVNPGVDDGTLPGAVSTVLFVGSSESIWSEVQRAAADIGLMPAAAVASEALERVEHWRHVICVFELDGDGEAVRTLQAIRSVHPGTIAIGVGEAGNPEAAAAGMRAGLFDVVNRPVRQSEFAALLANARQQIGFIATQRELPPVEVHPYGLFGTSAAMRDVMRLVQRAAPSRCGVILCGERGTGREMVARAIHAHGLRPQAPFVRVDCAAPTPQDLENELFGHVAARRGEREGKRRRLEQIGSDSRFADAIGGTLFLENIVEMPDRLQARLARLLRDREAMVADEPEGIEADVRPVATIEPSTTTAVEEGRLREDLFERLSVIRIDLPALRHRRDDIPLLAIHFLKEICRTNGSAPKTMTRSALALLTALPWRGNARELRTLLERLVLLVPHGVVRIEDVLAHVRLDATAPSVRSDATLREARMQFEREFIRAALQQHHGRMGEAAKSLGIQRTNLYRKVRSLKLSMPGMDKRR